MQIRLAYTPRSDTHVPSSALDMSTTPADHPTPSSSQLARDNPLFQALDTYPWSTDDEFRAGLSAIVGSNSDPKQVERLTLRARCFYYSRKSGVTVDFPQYQAWHAQYGTSLGLNESASEGPRRDWTALERPTEGMMRPTEATVQAVNQGTEEAPPYPMSFQEIVELISTGKEIPGIKDIPGTLLEGQSSEASKPKRRKPWEKDEVQVN